MQEVRHVDPAVDDALRVMGGGLRAAGREVFLPGFGGASGALWDRSETLGGQGDACKRGSLQYWRYRTPSTSDCNSTRLPDSNLPPVSPMSY